MKYVKLASKIDSIFRPAGYIEMCMSVCVSVCAPLILKYYICIRDARHEIVQEHFLIRIAETFSVAARWTICLDRQRDPFRRSELLASVPSRVLRGILSKV